jgi:hypothetical protein
MAQNAPKRKGAIIAVSLLVIAGIITYVIYSRRKSLWKPDYMSDTAPMLSQESVGGGVMGFTFPFKTTEEGNRFRGWVNDNYPSIAKELDLDRSGQLNSYLQKAWDRLGALYNLSSVAKNLGVNVSQGGVTVMFNSGRNKASFYNNGRFVVVTSENKIIVKGTYKNGGMQLIADNGKTAMGGSVWLNLANIIK